MRIMNAKTNLIAQATTCFEFSKNTAEAKDIPSALAQQVPLSPFLIMRVILKFLVYLVRYDRSCYKPPLYNFYFSNKNKMRNTHIKTSFTIYFGYKTIINEKNLYSTYSGFLSSQPTTNYMYSLLFNRINQFKKNLLDYIYIIHFYLTMRQTL